MRCFGQWMKQSDEKPKRLVKYITIRIEDLGAASWWSGRMDTREASPTTLYKLLTHGSPYSFTTLTPIDQAAITPEFKGSGQFEERPSRLGVGLDLNITVMKVKELGAKRQAEGKLTWTSDLIPAQQLHKEWVDRGEKHIAAKHTEVMKAIKANKAAEESAANSAGGIEKTNPDQVTEESDEEPAAGID